MPVWSLPEGLPFFPHPFTASEEGLLCISPDLTPEQVITAYSFGLFPWSESGDPIMWWFTSPRCVLYPQDVKISKSMRQFRRRCEWTITMNEAFAEVIASCAKPRDGQGGGTWIHPILKEAFAVLHEQGIVHSVEVWEGQELIGGLYGLALGKIFFGESMFSKKSNASKMALIHLCEFLKETGFWLIDCQQTTDHLVSMGATEISRDKWWHILSKNRLEALTSSE